MQVRRLEEASVYEAPKHHDMKPLRLQGWNASETKNFWVGLSYLLPGGGGEWDSTPTEKVYVVIQGEVTVVTDEGEATLTPLDSVHLRLGEARLLENRTKRPATILVVMTYPPQS